LRLSSHGIRFIGKFFEFFEVREEYPGARDRKRGEPIFDNIGFILIITSELKF